MQKSFYAVLDVKMIKTSVPPTNRPIPKISSYLLHFLHWQNYIFACYCMWVRNLVCHIKARTQAVDVQQYGDLGRGNCVGNSWLCGPTRSMASSFLKFLDHTQRRAKVVKTPLDEWSARRRERPVPENTQHSQQTNIQDPGRIRTHNISRPAAVDPRLRPRDHWDR